MSSWDQFALETKSVFIAVPVHPSISELPLGFWMPLMNCVKPSKFHLTINTEFEIGTARNSCVREFLNTDFTHILFLDCDIVLERDTILRLLAHAVPVISALYFTKGGDMSAEAWHHSMVPWKRDEPIVKQVEPGKFVYSRTGQPAPAVVETELMGFGCVLCERSVFERLKPPWFYYSMVDENLADDDRISEDFYFCYSRLYKELGIRPLVDTTTRVGHMTKAVVMGTGQVALTQRM